VHVHAGSRATPARTDCYTHRRLIAAGQTLGNYRVLAKIGTGGMGAVYLAEHPTIGKKIALKVIHRELAGNREVVQRFFQEARAVNKIGNEHIVEIHDFGVTPEGDHYFIMEYLEGQTLASVLSRETAMDISRALHVGAQIASALAAAHASGVIHRDLKPDNIMLMNRLGDPDFVKVLDFGLAKMFAAAGASAVQTAIGVLLGTPQYMSPEACEGKREIDHRTDIYALGVLLFQMMTGRLPFDGETMGEVLVKQVKALPPAPRGLNPAIPPSVEQILLRCLAKPVDARFSTMNALCDALLDPEAYLRGSPPIAPARSVAPGEAMFDARQVMAAAEARRRRTTGDGLPLPAPGSTDPTSAAASRQIPIPGLAQPAETRMNTMRIATPHGYSSRPPRRVWPVVLVVGLLLGLIGGAFVVAWFGRSETIVPGPPAAPATGSARTEPGRATAEPILETGSAAAGAGSAGSAAVGSGAAVAPVGSGALAKLTLDSVPRGATVYAPDGVALGKTPLKIEWPIAAAPVTFTLKLRGYRDKVHDIAVTSHTMTRVDLERLPAANPRGSASGAGRKDDTGLERPD
jgi:serine/threonine protein kinase